MDSCLSHSEVKCKQHYPGFELGSQIPFFFMLTFMFNTLVYIYYFIYHIQAGFFKDNGIFLVYDFQV